MNGRSLSLALLLAGVWGHSAWGQIPSSVYPIQDQLIGADLVQAMGITGHGVEFAVLDTGVAAPWTGFAPSQIRGPHGPTGSVCLIAPSCSRSLAVIDDNGHGTFVASEIVASRPLTAGSANPNSQVFGIAPGGKILSVKVLDAQGVGSYSDIANGIIYAANSGAKVLNLSLAPYSIMLNNAVNYAAAKGVVIVFAGGNNAAALDGGANIPGLTDRAIQSLIFMGSTNAAKALSAFSNTPGTASFVSTTGVTYSFASRWLVADGENLWGASNAHTGLTQLSGTSTTTPQAAAAAGLLLSRWPHLTNVQVTAILLATGQDLGAAGADATYGEGFLNVFNAVTTPVGGVSLLAGGRAVPASEASRLLASSALGAGGNVAAALQHAVGFDAFHRDFPLALGAAIAPRTTAGAAAAGAASVVMAQVGPGARSFTDLGDGAWVSTYFSGTASAPAWAAAEGQRANPGLIQDPTRSVSADWSVALAQRGTYFGVGQGSGAALSFNDARWGGRTAFFGSDADASAGLLGLPSGAHFATLGLDIGKHDHFAVGVIAAEDDTLQTLTGTGASARGMVLGYTWAPAKFWKLSLTGSMLAESNMLLGSPSGGYLSLGREAVSRSLGLGTNFDLGQGYQLGFDTMVAVTDPASTSGSLVTGTSRLMSAAFGLALAKQHLTDADDTLGISLKKPMRVYAGTAELAVPTGVDGLGNAIVDRQRAGLAPAGNESDVALAYDRPLGHATTAGLTFTYRRDANNLPGANDAAALVRVKAKF